MYMEIEKQVFVVSLKAYFKLITYSSIRFQYWKSPLIQ